MPTFGKRFGNLIRQKREDLGWSFAQLAVAAYGDDGQGGESRKSDVQKLEQGHSKNPNARTLKRYRDALNLAQDDIDACRTPQELQLAQFADALFRTITGAVAQTQVSDDLAAELSQRYAEGNPDSFEAALTGLRRALEVAAKHPSGGNLDADVAQIMAEVDRLNNAGDPDAAANALAKMREDMRAEEQRRAAAYLAVLDRSIDQAIVTRSVDIAAQLVAEKVDRETPDHRQRFAALRVVRSEWFERGRYKGLNFDLEVAIALARMSLTQAQDADQRGAAGNDLGIALAVLGQRETGTERLEQAVDAYQNTLMEWTRDSAPMGWAMTQNNMGNALSTLGHRETGTETLERAVKAYQNALQERTRDDVPLGWAATQNNLGNTLATLGHRETGTETLERALDACQNALMVWTRDSVPMGWAMTQNNLGSALTTLGLRETGTETLERAVKAYQNALQERTRDDVPLDWAATQNNLGFALETLGQRQTGTEALERAVNAYQNALLERTHDRVPLNWAMTQNNLGNALRAMGLRETGTETLKQAVNAYQNALQVRTRDDVPLGWAATQNNLGNALLAMGKRETGTETLERAVNAYQNALQERTRDRAPMDWASTQGNLGQTEIVFFDKTGDPTHLDAAESYVLAAKEVFEEAQATQFISMADTQLAEITTRRVP